MHGNKSSKPAKIRVGAHTAEQESQTENQEMALPHGCHMRFPRKIFPDEMSGLACAECSLAKAEGTQINTLEIT